MSDTPLISVLTPSVRPLGLVMVADCLARQTERRFEWLIGAPGDLKVDSGALARIRAAAPSVRIIPEPARRPGDFYRLNGAWNALVREARADLLVFTADWIWFEPGDLEFYLSVYREMPTACVSSFGHHYDEVDPLTGRPEVLHTSDIRTSQPIPESREMPAGWMELAFASIPKPPLVAVGGFDEAYDQVAGMSEKEVALRLEKAGCQFYLAKREIRNWTHPKTSTKGQWDRAYLKACELFERHAKEIAAGTRRVVEDPATRPTEPASA